MKFWQFKLNGIWLIINDFQYIFLSPEIIKGSKINTNEKFMGISYEGFALKLVNIN